MQLRSGTLQAAAIRDSNGVFLKISESSSDSWGQVFEAARNARAADLSDLVPFWVYTTEGGALIERHMPMIQLSKDVERAEVLRRSLAVYRMAFGQSRQDNLVHYLQRYLTAEQITAAVAGGGTLFVSTLPPFTFDMEI